MENNIYQFPKIMGILNATPDSFSDGKNERIGKNSTEFLYQKAVEMIENGADIIDVGGESTRPNSNEVSIEEEIERVKPIIEKLRKNYPKLEISIDTRRAEVAEELVKYDIDYINDVSGLTCDRKIAEIAAKHNIKLVVMHFREHDDCYYKNVVEEVFAFLEKQINIAKDMGVKDIIADIGIGFGKNKEDNLTLLKNFSYFDKLGLPHLLGISRKRFIGEVVLENTPIDRDIATILFHSLLLKEKSIKIIRVHNVEMAMQLKKVYESLN